MGVKITCSMTLGLGLGPLLCSFASWVCGAIEPGARAAGVSLLFVLLWVFFFVCLLTCIPEDVQGLVEAKKRYDADADEEKEDDCAVEKLDSCQRQTIWLTSLVYGFERALLVSGLEAATALLLESEFGWSTASIGVSVGSTFLATLPLTVLGESVQTLRWLTQPQVLCICSSVCCLASILLLPQIFNIKTMGPMTPAMLILFADAIIFSTGYLSQGTMDGLAIRASDRTSVYTQENYSIAAEISQNIGARLVGPAVARYLIISRGRESYAALQLLVSAIGCLSCWRVSHLIRCAKQCRHSCES